MIMLAIFMFSQATGGQLVPIVPIASAPSPQIEETPFDPRRATPMTYPGAWVTTADYPPESYRNEEQGTTGFKVTVDPQGLITGCQIIDSSGFSRLDETTCRLVTQRARFRSATDLQDKPIAGSYANRVRWVLPQMSAPEPGIMVITYTLQASGEVTDCEAKMERGAVSIKKRSAHFCSKTGRMKPYLDAENKPIARKVTVTTTLTVN